MPKLQPSHKKKKQQRTPKSPEAQFKREWERVHNFKQRNEQLRAHLNELVETVRPKVAASETARLDKVYDLSEHLIGFLTRRSLPDYLRDVLFDWIYENLNEMACNPFVNTSEQVTALHLNLQRQCEALNSYEQEKYEKKLLKSGVTQEAIDEAKQEAEEMISKVMDDDSEASLNEDMFADLFEEFMSDTMEGAEHLDDEDPHFWEHLFETDHEEAERSQAKELDQLLKATPINKLFRRIAKALHPDLEQSEEKKAEKHQLMSRLIEARDEKDIPSIIQMYGEYVGELPEGFFQGNYEKLTNLLKYQVERLQEEHDEILEEDPAKSLVYHMFDGKNDREVQKNITRFLKENQQRMASALVIRSDITSVASLRLYLEERYCEAAFDPFDGFL